jgi:hypothetical protein
VNHQDPAHREGYLMLAPYTACPTPRGWSREEACTLRDVYKLQARIQEQEVEDWKREGARDIDLLRQKFELTRDRMLTRMASSSTSAYDRDFMRAYLQLQEAKLAKHEARFECRNAYLWSLEMDAPKGRRDDEESFNVDRIG